MLTSQLSSQASAGSSLDASTSSLIRELIARVAQGEDLSEEVVAQLDDLVSLIRERSASQSADDKKESQRSGHRGGTFRERELNGISERRRAAVDMLAHAPALTHTAALEDADTAGHCLRFRV